MKLLPASETYCSYKLSKLLQKMGFRFTGLCTAYAPDDSPEGAMVMDKPSEEKEFATMPWLVPRPTIAMARTWFFINYKIHFVTQYEWNEGWKVRVQNKDVNTPITFIWNTEEEAVDWAMIKLIEDIFFVL